MSSSISDGYALRRCLEQDLILRRSCFMTKTHDALIIGAGQAGPPLAGRLSAAGMSVGLVERKLFGGTCVNTGCIPTKTLIASAYAAHLARRSAEYGVSVGGEVAVEMKAVKARKDMISTRARVGVESWL